MLVLLTTALFACSFLPAYAQTVAVSIPLSAPSSAVLLDPALVSFSIEQDRWTDWAGINAPNAFLQNALANLAQRTGTPPWIRIGADSEDHTDFSNDVQFSEAIFPAPSSSMPYPEASNVTVGSAYYALASHLPRGTRVIWGVNLGTSNLTAAFLEARAIRAAFASSEVKAAGVTLEAVEIGNEVDLYGDNGHRSSSTWTIAAYVQQWTTFAKNVSVAAGVSSSGPRFFGLAFGGTSHSASSFSPQGAFANGLLNSTQGKLINEISQHMYSGSGVAGVANLPSLMSKATIRANLSALSPDIAVVHAQGLDYVLGETNSYFSHGAPGVSNAAGAAIWALDYTLFAAQLGIKRAHFHEGVGYRYNFIQPATLNRSIIDASPLSTPLPPHIQPAYYGALIAAEAVGVSGVSHLSELSINDTTLAGYAIFEGGKLSRAVLIDSQAFLSGDAERPGRNVTLTFEGTGKAVGHVEVKRLVIGHADDTSGITWGGQSFETGDARPSGAIHTQTLVVNGMAGVTLPINATEAILLSFS